MGKTHTYIEHALREKGRRVRRKTDTEIVAEITSTLMGSTPRKRAAPHRCIDCQRVTRHVRCDACYVKRAEARGA